MEFLFQYFIIDPTFTKGLLNTSVMIFYLQITNYIL